jgi:hypothetical protein
MSRWMLEHYSHVRMAAKRTALDKLASRLVGGSSVETQPAVERQIERLRHNPRHNHSLHSLRLFLDSKGGRSRARTADLLLVSRAVTGNQYFPTLSPTTTEYYFHSLSSIA